MQWSNFQFLFRAATVHSKHFLSVHIQRTLCLFNVHVRVMVVWWYRWRGEEETSLAGRGPPIRTTLTSGCTSWTPLFSRWVYTTVYYSILQYITVYDGVLQQYTLCSLLHSLLLGSKCTAEGPWFKAVGSPDPLWRSAQRHSQNCASSWSFIEISPHCHTRCEYSKVLCVYHDSFLLSPHQLYCFKSARRATLIPASSPSFLSFHSRVLSLPLLLPMKLCQLVQPLIWSQASCPVYPKTFRFSSTW